MELIMNRYHSVLSIAGSDSGGCAGIQADIKSISANGGYAATVITATTAQNTQGVTDIHPLPISHIEAQLEAVLSDIEFDAIKIGMLHSAEVIEVVHKMLAKYGAKNIVLDPVMVATSGDTLITNEAIEALKVFFPSTYLITPNIPEAELLIGHEITIENIKESAKELSERFSVSVLLKGGHLSLEAQMTDVLYIKEAEKTVVINHKSVDTKNTHGTGCSLSSAIATHLALGSPLEKAVRSACTYLNEAIDAGKDKLLGKGNGPVHHFYQL
ncbi:MAG TPA: bifunctional hydroxymethylpyrimidine kinase/phosphomethylpyrimidine kinase [Campylobacterales bacterium]|nr:bifunctional hydroxymethylpyrimidine kinase/phosphomethylpyrimidine kinase [Campylobacterales bacterium]